MNPTNKPGEIPEHIDTGVPEDVTGHKRPSRLADEPSDVEGHKRPSRDAEDDGDDVRATARRPGSPGIRAERRVGAHVRRLGDRGRSGLSTVAGG